ncbi:MAG: amino acid ABC transporter permease, partial [Alphaproteobacteria bacterium]
MSDTTTTQSYPVGQHPDMPPPLLESGIIYWIRKNLLSSWTNATLTLIGLYGLWVILPPFYDWAFGDAIFNAADRAECQSKGDGACWAFIQERFKIFIYGFYPEPERWRSIVAFVLLFVAIGPLLFDKFP